MIEPDIDQLIEDAFNGDSVAKSIIKVVLTQYYEQYALPPAEQKNISALVMMVNTWKGNKVRGSDGTFPEPKRPDTIGCGHNEHYWLEYLGIWWCESAGQFVCGKTNLPSHPKSTCNVCNTNHGNLYCLNRHLKESPDCRADFNLQLI